MPKYKVTKVFMVEAASKLDAVDQVTNNAAEALEFISVLQQMPDKPKGWLGVVRSQVAGK